MMLAATVAACTVEDIKEQPEGPHTYTMTVKASKGVDTKALYFGADGKLNAKWKEGEEKETVTVKEGDTELGTLTAYPDPVDPTKATLKGDLDTPPSANGVELTLEFNSADGYSSQDGTLSYIASHTDYATATTTVTINGTNVTGTSASFENQNAIVKFALQDKSNSSLLTPNIFKVSVMYNFTMQAPRGGSILLPIELKSYEFTIDPSVYTSENALYFALPSWSYVKDKAKKAIEDSFYAQYINIEEALGLIYLEVTVTDGDDTYIYKRTDPGYPFVASKYYDITVKMTKQYRSMDKATTNDIGKVIGANGKIYVNAAEASAAKTTAEAMIAYVGAVSGVCEHGLAVELKDYSTSDNSKNTYTSFTLSEAQNYAAGKTEITGGTWRLPKDEDWQYMFTGNTATTEFNISSFQTKMGLVGNALVDGYYWTDTQITIENKIYQQIIYHSSNAASVQHSATDQYWHVRACLAF